MPLDWMYIHNLSKYTFFTFRSSALAADPTIKVKQPSSPNRNARPPSISAVYESTVGSQEAIVERAKQVTMLYFLKQWMILCDIVDLGLPVVRPSNK